MLATTSVKSWKNCVASELKQHRYLRTEVGAVFLIGFVAEPLGRWVWGSASS